MLDALKRADISIKPHSRKLTKQQLADQSTQKAQGLSQREIAALRAKYQRIAKLDKAAADNLDLDQLFAKAKEVTPDPDAKTRKQDWIKFEKDVCAGAENLFKIGFFEVNGKKIEDKSCKAYAAKRIGGSRKSDVQVSHSNRCFFIECKLDYESANYFKFGVKVESNKITYDYHFFLPKSMPEEEKQKVAQLFKDIDLGNFLTQLANSNSQISYNWKNFNRNIDRLVEAIKTDSELKEFSKKLGKLSVFPDDFKQLEEVFDLYLNYYIDRYNEIVERILSYVADEDKHMLDHLRDRFCLRDFDDEEEVMSGIEELALVLTSDLPLIMDLSKGEDGLYYFQLPDKQAQDEIGVLRDEVLRIETKFNAILDANGKEHYNFAALKKIVGSKKLKYLYSLFIGAQKRKNARKEFFMDEIGNMVVFKLDDVELPELSKKICQFYLVHGKCHYIQVDDCIFALDKEHNALGLKDLPQFEESITRFNVALVVSDDLKEVSLKVFAVKPDSGRIDGEQYSFRQQDANYVGKKHEPVKVVIED